MTRSRSTSSPGAASVPQSAGSSFGGRRPLLLLALLGALGGVPAAWAQPAAETITPGAARTDTAGSVVAGTPVTKPLAATVPATLQPAPNAAADSAASVETMPPATKPTSNWNTLWAVLGGVVLGVLGAWLWMRRSAKPAGTARPLPEAAPAAPAGPARKNPAENVWKSPGNGGAAADTFGAAGQPAASATPASAETPGKGASVKSMREVQGNTAKQPNKSAGSNKKNKSNFNSRSSADDAPSGDWPPVPHRPATMNPDLPTPSLIGNDQPLEAGQTIEWAAPTSTPPAIQEMMAASAPAAASDAAAETPAPGNGPLHYYAPAPDVPSIEHRKLSPNPLPQMPLLITLPYAAAETAQFSFSPQADQSRIIGNGVRELKEFFQFELPPTEQFTAIKNLTPGKLEKRDDVWHVVQKAEIALS